MQKITPFLWFNDQAEDAVNFYTSIFKNSKIQNVSRYENEGSEVSVTAKGKVMTMTFEIDGQLFMALNGGPYFNFTPAISFFVNCETLGELNMLWDSLSSEGIVLMELDTYAFSKRFGWVKDKFGISWQLNLANHIQKITPFLMFVGDKSGKAEEAMNFYISLFNNSRINEIQRYGVGEGEVEGTVKHATFSLDFQEFIAIDSNMEHDFTFSEAISLFVNCETQSEVDLLWEKLSQDGVKGQCGWIKDKYGVSWQIVPTILGELLNDSDIKKSQRVMNAMLQMTKINIEELKVAYALN